MAKAMAFAIAAGADLSPRLRAGPGNATRVSPPAWHGAPQTGRSGNSRRPAPDPAGAKRPPWAGRALAGGIGPRLVLMPAQRCGRGDGPCQRDRASRRTSLRAGTGNATRVSPARAGRCPVDRSAQAPRKASARPGGGEAPARGGSGAGRGLWPPAGAGHSGSLWQRRWPLPWQRGLADCGKTFWPIHGRDQETRPAFPPPVRDGPPQTGRFRNNAGQRPTRRAGSARRGRAGRWPGALAPGWSRISVALSQGRWPLPLQRCQCFRPSGREPETRPAFPPPACDSAL